MFRIGYFTKITVRVWLRGWGGNKWCRASYGVLAPKWAQMVVRRAGVDHLGLARPGEAAAERPVFFSIGQHGPRWGFRQQRGRQRDGPIWSFLCLISHSFLSILGVLNQPWGGMCLPKDDIDSDFIAKKSDSGTHSEKVRFSFGCELDKLS